MVYATRSGKIAPAQSAASTSHALGKTMPSPKMKRTSASTPLTRRRHSVTNDTTPKVTGAEMKSLTKTDVGTKVTPAGGVYMNIDTTNDPHNQHILDGNEHNLEEQDGRNRHHIFYEDFENQHPTVPRQTRAMNKGDGEPMDLDANSDENTLLSGQNVQYGIIIDGGAHAPASQPRTRRRSSITLPLSSRSTAANYSASLEIHVDYSSHKHQLDGVDHHLVEADGRDHHHIRFEDENSEAEHPTAIYSRHRSSTSSSGAYHDDTATSSHKIAKKTADSTAAASHHAAISAQDSDFATQKTTVTTRRGSVTSNNEDSTSSHKSATSSHVPMHQIEADVTAYDKQVNKATTSHFGGSNITTTTTTTTTAIPSTSVETQEERHRLRTRDAAALRLISQKAQLDRAKARDAMLSLDSDVIQLQKLLQAKEDALRTAESQALSIQKSTTVRTETLTKEVHDLRVTVQDLRTNLTAKEKVLMSSQKEVETVKKADHKEIHAVEVFSEKLKKDLDKAVEQRDSLAKEVEALTQTLKDREMDLKAVLGSVKGLERKNVAQEKLARRLSTELTGLKSTMSNKEKELKNCHIQIKHLESEHTKVLKLTGQLKNLRSSLDKKETALKEMKKETKSMTKDHLKNQQELTKEVESLTQEIHEAENMLRGAQAAVDRLAEFRDQAATLEVEVHELRDQVNIHEKHESDLEDALMAHENCAFETQQLQGSINTLQARLNEKQTEIQNLQNSNAKLRQEDETRISQLKTEIFTLQSEISAHDLDALKLKEKVDKDLAKINSTAAALRIEVIALRQQVKDKTAELKKSDKSHSKTVEQIQSENLKLSEEIKKLDALIMTKDKHASELDKVVADMIQHAQRADKLEKELSALRKDSKKAADKSAKDLNAMANSTSKLTQQIEALKTQLASKESELKAGEKIAEDLHARLLSIEATSKTNLDRAKNAEASVDSLNSEIKTLKSQLSSLQSQLTKKETKLTETVTKASKDHGESLHHVEELRNLIDALTKEIGDNTSLIRQKDISLQEIQQKLSQQSLEIKRLHTVLSHTRTELTSDRKRHASEVEESIEKFNTTKDSLEHQIGELKDTNQGLKDSNQGLKKRAQQEHLHEIHELELAKQVKELTVWKEHAVAQTKAQEDVLKNLQNEKNQLTEQASSLQKQLDVITATHTSTLNQCDKLIESIKRMGKETILLKGVAAQHDKEEIKMQIQIQDLQCKDSSLENAKAMLTKENEEKDETIEELQASLKEKAGEAKKDQAAKEKLIAGLKARVTDLDKSTTTLQSSLEKSEAALFKSQQYLKSKDLALTSSNSKIEALTEQIQESNLLVTALRQETLSLQSEITTMESKMHREMTTNHELTEMLTQLRKSMKRDSEQELEKLDQLEAEIKNRESIVEETISLTRNRMDSGAFMDQTETTVAGEAHTAALPENAGDATAAH
ncbi:hypothetical protein FBU30_007027 [Linnemannia zychae]|nr:hypothetical protein FBU30_007027 [Linnemannia zychae]